MEYSIINGETHYKLRTKRSHSHVIGLVVLFLMFGLIATVVGSAFGYAALG